MSKISYLKDTRIILLIAIIAALAIFDVYYGLHFGIEFSGGTEIPILLEHSVNATTMASLISDLNQRVSTFGLKQVTVEGIGNSEVYVIIPSETKSDINQTINIIQSQGRFLAVVNGKEALNGADILKGSVGSIPPSQSNNTVLWSVTFFITQSATSKFAKAVFGQANQPLYMFLDRPLNTAIVMNQSILLNNSQQLQPNKTLSIMESVLSLQNSTIPLLQATNSNYSTTNIENFFSAHKQYKIVLASYNLNPALISKLKSMNLTVVLESNANMTPQFTSLGFGNASIDSWNLIGLLSAPILNPSVTNGSVGDSYEITGVAPPTMSVSQQFTYSANQEKTITSILNGGALPVEVIPQTPTTIPPTLGTQALYVSGIIGLLSVVAVSTFITLRYRKPFLVVPILLTTFTELFIIVSIIGLVGSIDLAAVAGMIAVVGTGVDAQIIITDEIVAHGNEYATSKGLLGKAFYIVWADAALLVIAMLPLFFSTSLVDVIGFSEATIIGALLGVFVTRPAYGALLSRHFSE